VKNAQRPFPQNRWIKMTLDLVQNKKLMVKGEQCTIQKHNNKSADAIIKLKNPHRHSSPVPFLVFAFSPSIYAYA
jgi:hypothetical protein